MVSVGTFSDEDMHFREMKIEILTVGLDAPDAPIDVDIKYDDGDSERSVLAFALAAAMNRPREPETPFGVFRM